MRRTGARQPRRWAVLATVLLLAACDRPPPVGIPGEVRGFAGVVVADEPRAATVAAAVLRRGGTAVDAAVALYFALAVTHLAAAGLGAGGVYLNYDAITAAAESLEFVPRTPAAGGGIAVPGSVRGFSALHARYGRLPWSALVDPVARLARDGHSLAHVAAASLAAAAGPLRAEPQLRAIFTGGAGQPLGEGHKLVQIELGAVLSQIARRGSAEVYGGGTGRLLVEASTALGGGLTMADLHGYQVRWQSALAAALGDVTLYAGAPPPAAGSVAAALWRALVEGGCGRADAEGRRELLRTTSRAAYALRAGPPPPDPAAGAAYGASFVVADRGGSAVACALTMAGPLGVAGSARPTGIAFAPAVSSAGAEDLTAVIVVGRDGALLFAAVAASDPGGPAAVAQVGVAVMNGTPLGAALALPRAYHPGSGETFYVESAALPLGRVNALNCPDGLARDPETCAFAADPRGRGLALSLDEE